MAKRERRRFTSLEKSRAITRHLQDGVSVSEICDDLRIHPTQFYSWRKQALESLPKAFESDSGSADRRQRRKIERLEADVERKNSVIAELLSEHIALKKSLGEN